MQVALLKIVVWKEQEHELDEIRGASDQVTVNALHEYGILKLFKVPIMRSQVILLEYILGMWNHEQQHFEVGSHILTMEVEYIYFLTGLSRKGAPISLTDPHGGDITTQDLIDQYCFPGTQMSGNKIPIKDVMDLSLWIVLFMMQHIFGSQGACQ